MGSVSFLLHNLILLFLLPSGKCCCDVFIEMKNWFVCNLGRKYWKGSENLKLVKIWLLEQIKFRLDNDTSLIIYQSKLSSFLPERKAGVAFPIYFPLNWKVFRDNVLNGSWKIITSWYFQPFFKICQHLEKIAH